MMDMVTICYDEDRKACKFCDKLVEIKTGMKFKRYLVNKGTNYPHRILVNNKWVCNNQIETSNELKKVVEEIKPATEREFTSQFVIDEQDTMEVTKN